jgi:hypothetical protein
MKLKELFREIFILAVRLLSLYLFYRGVMVLVDSGSVSGRNPPERLISCVVCFAAAYWLFKGPVIRWAYPETKAGESKAGAAGDAAPQEAEDAAKKCSYCGADLPASATMCAVDHTPAGRPGTAPPSPPPAS